MFFLSFSEGMVFLSQIPTEGYLCGLLYYIMLKGERVDLQSDRLQVQSRLCLF